MKTLIVTLNYNTPKLIEDLGKSLIKHLPKSGWEWLIRDNSTNDESVKAIESLENDKFKIIRKPNTGNYASMHNELMNEGYMDDFTDLILLNNDMIAMSDFLSHSLTYLRDPEVGAVGANLYYPNGHLQHCGIVLTEEPYGIPTNISKLSAMQLKLFPSVAQRSRIYVAVTGAMLAMRVKDYKALNGMDENFQWCFDDVDLCFRLYKELGKICVTNHLNKLIHLGNYSTLKNPTNLKPNYHEAIKLLKSKHEDYIHPDSGLYRMDYNIYA